jgi:hypothetical protein
VQRCGRCDAGVVDEDVDGAVAIARGGEGGGDGGFVGDIAGDAVGVFKSPVVSGKK